MGGTTDPDSPTPTALPWNFNKYLMSAYYVPGTLLGDQDMVADLMQLSQVEKAENKPGNCHVAWEELVSLTSV